MTIVLPLSSYPRNCTKLVWQPPWGHLYIYFLAKHGHPASHALCWGGLSAGGLGARGASADPLILLGSLVPRKNWIQSTSWHRPTHLAAVLYPAGKGRNENDLPVVSFRTWAARTEGWFTFRFSLFNGDWLTSEIKWFWRYFSCVLRKTFWKLILDIISAWDPWKSYHSVGGGGCLVPPTSSSWPRKQEMFERFWPLCSRSVSVARGACFWLEMR